MPRTYALYLTSIITGFCMMALEIVGARILFPGFGSSIDVWAAIISVFILSLSVGYWLGGRIADRARSNSTLGAVIVASGVFYALLPMYGIPLIDAFPMSLQTAKVGVLVAALILFLPPSLLLGTVSPMLVRLVFTGEERVGRTTGTLYAIGSVGNVLGVLSADYLLLPNFTLNGSIQTMGGVLIILGSIHLAKRIPTSGNEVSAPAADDSAEAAPAAEAAVAEAAS